MSATLTSAAAAVTAFITLFGAVWYFILPRLREQVTGKLERIEHQVVNSHRTNLRDDLDELHDEVIALKIAVQSSEAYYTDTREQLNRHLEEAQTDGKKLDQLQGQVGRIEGLLEGYFRSQRSSGP